MRILVTRPQPEAQALCDRLTALGHEAIVDPLLTVEFLDFDIANPARYAGIVVTSRNALRGLARSAQLRAALGKSPLFAVGPATAELARSLGFGDVVMGRGTAVDLPDTVSLRLRPAAGPLLSLTAEMRAFDVAAALRARRYDVDEAIVYRTAPATAFQPGTLVRLAEGSIDAVMLLSPRTAQTYASLIAKHNHLKNIDKIAHLCLSCAVADRLSPLAPLTIRKAAYPNLEELLALAASEAKPSP